MFYEIEEVEDVKNKDLRDEIANSMKKHGLRPGANITVIGGGGAGRNAVKSMRELGLDKLVKLVEADTDIPRRLRTKMNVINGGKYEH